MYSYLCSMSGGMHMWHAVLLSVSGTESNAPLGEDLHAVAVDELEWRHHKARRHSHNRRRVTRHCEGGVGLLVISHEVRR